MKIDTHSQTLCMFDAVVFFFVVVVAFISEARSSLRAHIHIFRDIYFANCVNIDFYLYSILLEFMILKMKFLHFF